MRRNNIEHRSQTKFELALNLILLAWSKGCLLILANMKGRNFSLSLVGGALTLRRLDQRRYKEAPEFTHAPATFYPSGYRVAQRTQHSGIRSPHAFRW